MASRVSGTDSSIGIDEAAGTGLGDIVLAGDPSGSNANAMIGHGGDQSVGGGSRSFDSAMKRRRETRFALSAGIVPAMLRDAMDAFYSYRMVFSNRERGTGRVIDGGQAGQLRHLAAAASLLTFLLLALSPSEAVAEAPPARNPWSDADIDMRRVTVPTSEHGVLLGFEDGDGAITYPLSEMARYFEVPDWSGDPDFPDDVFSFARLMYASYGRRWGRDDRRWTIDFPEAELNLSFRLEQLTSLRADPNPVSLPINARALERYPFVYMVEPGRLALSQDEARDLRDYLLNGGFLMVDDFWGEDEWAHFYEEFRSVFPELPPGLPQSTEGAETPVVTMRELPLEHPIFNFIFELEERPQIPAVGNFLRTGLPFERYDATEVHYKGLFDSEGRMMGLICHNTDFGDGWEREGIDPRYFSRFSEPQAYPMAINVLFYVMTH